MNSTRACSLRSVGPQPRRKHPPLSSKFLRRAVPLLEPHANAHGSMGDIHPTLHVSTPSFPQLPYLPDCPNLFLYSNPSFSQPVPYLIKMRSQVYPQPTEAPYSAPSYRTRPRTTSQKAKARCESFKHGGQPQKLSASGTLKAIPFKSILDPQRKTTRPDTKAK